MKQNNISSILKNNPIIPVATIDELSKVDKYYEILNYQNITVKRSKKGILLFFSAWYGTDLQW